jgi:1-acyl-sn-glycerol-3-phosphate acyltransferase
MDADSIERSNKGSTLFVAKSEVAGWPLIGYLCRFVGTVFLDRSSRSGLPATADAMVDLLAAGVRITFFPEGTTTRGDRVLPFRPALLRPAVATRSPVACVALHSETPEGSPPADDSVCWWGDATFASHIYRFMRLPSVEARVGWAEHAPVATNRRALARLTHAFVANELHALGALRASHRRAEAAGRRDYLPTTAATDQRDSVEPLS